MDALSASAIQHDLRTAVIGRAIEYYPQIGSTNDLIRRRAREGSAEGLLVIADEQMAGRGRLGRGWAAPPGTSLLMSLLLRPTWMAPSDLFTLTMLAGVVLCEAVEQLIPVRAALKWPNDLLLPQSNGGAPLRKAAGILSEIELDRDRVAWVAIGMGVNVNWAPHGRVDGRDLGMVATSVGAAARQPIDRLALLRALLLHLDRGYLDLRHGQREKLFLAWRDRLATIGQRVVITTPRGEIQGVADGVDPTGALLVRDDTGLLHPVLAGDVGI
jgi:BirA family biotin operon repressor/biotin-[acetyl-CoA-carboxylase] ligase